METRISLIIPALNEAGRIGKTLSELPPYENLERIVVDGGSSDETASVAHPWADRVIGAPPGRARQMNAGARFASGDVLLFLHADTCLPPRAFSAVVEALEDPAVVGGAFRLAIDSPRLALRIVSWAANIRTRLTRVPYGDQGIFVRRRIFEGLGGFPDLPIMEDLEFGRRLREMGKVVLLPEAARTSSRRWDRGGVARTTIRNQLLKMMYFMGISPGRIARWYRPVR